MSSQQPSLFDTDPAPWEIDDGQMRLVATVVLVSGPDGEFDYLVPDMLASQVEAGRRLQVPLGRGNRTMVGYCVRVANRVVASSKMKYVERVLDDRPLLSPAMLEMTQWIADYYLCTWGQVLRSVIPAGVRSYAGTREAVLLSVPEKARKQIPALKLSPQQLQILDTLRARGPMTAAALMDTAGCSTSPIQTLRKKGLIDAHTERISTYTHEEVRVARESNLELNADQKPALESVRTALDAGEHRTILLHGVTGSGKTEIYMQAIEHVISFGRQAIVLVPEISLTPQTRERFRRRFDKVAVLHSHLTDVERAWHWDQIASGDIQVIVGARSAIFAPTPHLGLIILDEEHESSFKQDKAPRYHARDVALFRAAREKVPLVLGSATPSLETFHRAMRGEFQLVELPRRVMDRPLPGVIAVDLRDDLHQKNSHGAISRKLHQAIELALRDEGQVILLLNRRGFSTHMQCPACGHVIQCPHCELALTHHRHDEIALCHYCDYEIPLPTECPECHATDIRHGGRGTQKLEMEVKARFPNATCLRMDTDSMRKPGSHEEALSRFRSGEVQILLGTQMIAKGLDFPNVTVVGVINADTALHLPDFRAAERTFHLVTQVAGRTGRGEKGGRVLVQTFSPDHYAIEASMRHDYAEFAAAELPQREALGYPPFQSMVRIVVRGPMAKTAQETAETLADRVRQTAVKRGVDLRVLGPAPAPFPKLRGNYRFHFQVQALDGPALRACVREATTGLKLPEEVEWMADVDPLDML